MHKMRLTVYLVFLFCAIFKSASADDVVDTKKITASENKVEVEFTKSQPEKRDSNGQTGSYSNNEQQPQPQGQIKQDEPFRPIYRPNYPKEFTPQPTVIRYLTNDAIASQTEAYFDKPQLADGIRYVTSNHNDGGSLRGAQNSPLTPAHSAIPLAGSYITSGGGKHFASSAYRGPFNPVAHQQRQREQQLQSKPQEQQKPVAATTAKIFPLLLQVKGPQHNLAYVEPVTNFLFDRALPKPLPQKHEQTQKQQLQQEQHSFLQPLHQHHYQLHQPYQHQSLQQQQQQYNVRLSPQHHIQYIIAIPLSHIRQLQQQQQETSATSSLPKQAEPNVGSHSVIGPLARDHYGAYRPAYYASSKNQAGEHASPAAPHYDNQEPQYTTQYIQLPANILHAAVQAAHIYQHRQQQQQHQQQEHRLAYIQSQPRYLYYPQQVQQQQEQQQQQNVPVYAYPVQEKPQSQKPQQEAIIHIGGAKPSAKVTPPKTSYANAHIAFLPTPATPSTVQAADSSTTPASAPLVHYNPIYVQAPPPEQQSLFGQLNYHRFATGAFQATTPVPFIRLSPTPSQHYYTAPPFQQHLHHQQPPPQPYHSELGHKTFYSTYAPEQIPAISAGLPYFTHPGGVHYGTHLYHPAPAFIASPPLPRKAVETVNGSTVGNQHHEQQHQQQQQPQHEQQLHSQYAVTPSPSSSMSVDAAASAASASGAESGVDLRPLVKYP